MKEVCLCRRCVCVGGCVCGVGVSVEEVCLWRECVCGGGVSVEEVCMWRRCVCGGGVSV